MIVDSDLLYNIPYNKTVKQSSVLVLVTQQIRLGTESRSGNLDIFYICFIIDL